MKIILLALALLAGAATANAGDTISVADMLGTSIGRSFARAGIGNGAELSAGTNVAQGDGWLLAGDVQLSRVRVTNTITTITPATMFTSSTTITTSGIGTAYRVGAGILAREAVLDTGFARVSVLERVGVQVDMHGRDFSVPLALGIAVEPATFPGFMFDARLTRAHDQKNLATLGISYQF